MTTSVLHQPCLVLNRNWQAVNVANVARALVLLWNDHAKVVDVNDYQMFTWEDWASIDPADGDRFIQSTSVKLRVPEVIVLNNFDKLPETAVTFSRRNLFKRDKYVCQICSRQPGLEELTIDHVVPRAKGGISSWENCIVACVSCNRKKADFLLEEVGMKLRRQPFKPKWRPVYAVRDIRLDSWKKFISEAYWNIELVK